MTDDEIAARLVAGFLAGPHHSHSQADNIRNAGMLITGDEDFTFGIEDVVTATAEEALEAMAAVTGAREPGEAYIDPARTIAGIRAAAAKLGDACRAGARILVATGHPKGLLPHHGRLVRVIEAAGGKVETPLDGVEVANGEGPRRTLRYYAGVGALTDGVDTLHTHYPDAMRAILATGGPEEWPDLVVADHGFTGAAINRGIPAIAVIDTNDPALGVAWARGRDVVLIPMDDHRRPDTYNVVAEVFEEALAR